MINRNKLLQVFYNKEELEMHKQNLLKNYIYWHKRLNMKMNKNRKIKNSINLNKINYKCYICICLYYYY